MNETDDETVAYKLSFYVSAKDHKLSPLLPGDLANHYAEQLAHAAEQIPKQIREAEQNGSDIVDALESMLWKFERIDASDLRQGRE
jgi:hypothetical protein